MSSTGRSAGVLLTIAMLTCPARADEAVLTPVKDNSLFADPNGLLSNGAGGTLFAGRTSVIGGEAIRRGLVAFDLSQIPPSSTVTAVQLTMTVTNLGPSALLNPTVNLHRVQADWGEGTSVA